MQSFLKVVAQSLINLGIPATVGFDGLTVDGCCYNCWESTRRKNVLIFASLDAVKMNTAGIQECVLHVIGTLAGKREQRDLAAHANSQHTRLSDLPKVVKASVSTYSGKYELRFNVDANQELLEHIIDCVLEGMIRYAGKDAGEIDWRSTETIPEDHYAM